MPTTESLSNLVLNSIPTMEIYNYLKNNNLLNENELYLVEDFGASGMQIDHSPTENSINLVTSGGVYSALLSRGSSAHSCSLTVSGWSNNTQTVSVTGVTETNNILISPNPNSQHIYNTSGIVCTTQSPNSLTFTCLYVPSNTLTVNVIIL